MGYGTGMNLLDDLRKLIQADGRTRYRLSVDGGIEQSALSRLLSGERGLSLASAERLAATLGYRLTLVRLPRRKQRGGDV